MRLRLGTRGSALALAQSRQVAASLEALPDRPAVELVVIKTTADKMPDADLAQIPGKGVFIKEIEEALLESRVDLAVHSLKDLPTDTPPGLVVAAVPEREDPRDCLISRFGEQLQELPRGAIVATGSPRRQAQVKAAAKRAHVVPVRGNLDTRLRKLQEGEFTSIVVAYAGVRRLGRAEEVSQVLDFDLMLPAPGQGCLGLECRADDGATRRLAEALSHAPSFQSALAERAFLAALGGGCRVPIAACAREEGGVFVLDGLVISPDGKRAVRGRESGLPEQARVLGERLAGRLLKEGAAALLSDAAIS